MEYQEISRKKIPKTNMKIDKKYLPYIVVGVGAGLIVFLTRKGGGVNSPQSPISEGDSVGGNVGGLINDMQVGFNNQLQELDTNYRKDITEMNQGFLEQFSNITNQFTRERESMTDYLQEVNNRLDETVRGNVNQIADLLNQNAEQSRLSNQEIQRLREELNQTKNQMNQNNQTGIYDLMYSILQSPQTNINTSGGKTTYMVDGEGVKTEFVTMYTKSGSKISVNPSYVDEYLKKGYTLK